MIRETLQAEDHPDSEHYPAPHIDLLYSYGDGVGSFEGHRVANRHGPAEPALETSPQKGATKRKDLTQSQNFTT